MRNRDGSEQKRNPPILFYRASPDGPSTFGAEVRAFGPVVTGEIFAKLNALRDDNLREGEVRYLGNSLWEIKVSVERSSYRVAYSTVRSGNRKTKVVLAIKAFEKRGRKEPQAVKEARRRLDDWHRKNNENKF